MSEYTPYDDEIVRLDEQYTDLDLGADRVARETVGTPGSDSEYFADDYDQVHCIHGRFVGYPGGADFICGLCEDGATVLEHRIVARLEYTCDGDSEWEQPKRLDTCYSPKGMAQWDEFIALVKRSNAGWMNLYWSFEVESYWVRPEEADESNDW